MAQAGVARAVVPAHSLYDGDTIYALSTGSHTGVEVTVLGTLAAQLMSQAIVNGILHADGVDGLPSHRDFFGKSAER
jgi:L-aminopeptidase/D-esterase-like protein